MLFTAACGLAPTLPVLVAVRVVRAGGAAMLQANSVALGTTSARPSGSVVHAGLLPSALPNRFGRPP